MFFEKRGFLSLRLVSELSASPLRGGADNSERFPAPGGHGLGGIKLPSTLYWGRGAAKLATRGRQESGFSAQNY